MSAVKSCAVSAAASATTTAPADGQPGDGGDEARLHRRGCTLEQLRACGGERELGTARVGGGGAACDQAALEQASDHDRDRAGVGLGALGQVAERERLGLAQ